MVTKRRCCLCEHARRKVEHTAEKTADHVKVCALPQSRRRPLCWPCRCVYVAGCCANIYPLTECLALAAATAAARLAAASLAARFRCAAFFALNSLLRDADQALTGRFLPPPVYTACVGTGADLAAASSASSFAVSAAFLAAFASFSALRLSCAPAVPPPEEDCAGCFAGL